MKENEEPEKIYCIPTEGGCYYITTIKPEPPFADGVEYTRTDAFIEKACSWLEEHMIGWNNDFVKDFRKYMEGE